MFHEVVREELETLIMQRAPGREPEGVAQGAGLPRFVERELRAYLDCGVLARGFLRMRCESCGAEQQVAFSCKSRAACPSCATRRMYDGAAFLVGSVLPEVPFRQWVLSVPRWVRLRLALDGELLSRVLAMFLRAIFSWQRRRARELGVYGANTFAVSFVQRFSSALRLNVHFHSLVPDGVFARPDGDASEPLRFVYLGAPSNAEVEVINRRLAGRVHALFARLAEEVGEDELSDDGSALAESYAEALQPALPGTQTPGVHAEKKRGPRCSFVDGYSLHANVHVPAGDRRRLERLCRYGLRPPFALERMAPLEPGRIAYRMKRAGPDGATHRIFTRLGFLSAVAALIPPPRRHLTRYHGLFAPSARDRAGVLPRGRKEAHRLSDAEAAQPASRGRRLMWAELLKNVFAIDVFTCERCGARRRVLAAITAERSITAILTHIGQPARAPPVSRPRPTDLPSPELEVLSGANIEPERPFDNDWS